MRTAAAYTHTHSESETRHLHELLMQLNGGFFFKWHKCTGRCRLWCVCASCVQRQFMDFPFIDTARAKWYEKAMHSGATCNLCNECINSAVLRLGFLRKFSEFNAIHGICQKLNEIRASSIHNFCFEGFESIIDAIWCNVENTEEEEEENVIEKSWLLMIIQWTTEVNRHNTIQYRLHCSHFIHSRSLQYNCIDCYQFLHNGNETRHWCFFHPCQRPDSFYHCHFFFHHFQQPKECVFRFEFEHGEKERIMSDWRVKTSNTLSEQTATQWKCKCVESSILSDERGYCCK